MNKKKKPQVLMTNDGTELTIAAPVETPYHYLTQVEQLRYFSIDEQSLVISKEDLAKNFDVIDHISHINYQIPLKQFACYKQVYKNKVHGYFIVMGDQLLSEHEGADEVYDDNLLGLYAYAYDPAATNLDRVTLSLNTLFTIYNNNASKVSIVLKTMMGYSFKNYSIKPLPLDIDKMYNDDFGDVNSDIIAELSGTTKGIVLLHGAAGTGKTNYIKYLTTVIPEKKFVFIPISMISSLTDPSFISNLIDNKGSILVLEDSETYLQDRTAQDNPVVSTILNLSDGMLSDVLGIQIICTFNADLNKVDEALLREGRLIAEYEFKELSVDKGQKLVDDLNINYTVTTPMTLAELTNLNKKSHRDQKKSSNKIGFK